MARPARTERIRIRQLRDALGMTQRELADEFGVAPAAVAQWESGQRQMSGAALKLLQVYETETGLDDASAPAESFLPIGPAARGKGALKMVALWSVYRYLASDAAPSSIAGRLRLQTLGRYVETASNLKSLAMKLLQTMAFLDMVVDERERETIARARTKATPMPATVVRGVFEKAFGKAPNDLFASWTARPFEQTSLGQVHRATLADGRDVVVKVQHPLLIKALKADLENVERLDRLYSFVVRGQEPGVIFAELRDRFLEECDYTLEAANQREFGALFRDRPNIHVPEVVTDASTSTVLTTEYVPALRFDEFVEHGSRAAKDRAAAAIWEFFIEALHGHSLLNADVHPGNFLFGEDGRVSFIDFGRVKRFPPNFEPRYRALLCAILERDHEAFRRAIDALGVTRSGFDYEAGFRMYAFMSAPMLLEGPYTFGADFVRKSWRVWATHNPNHAYLNRGRDHVFWYQFLFGLAALSARLKARVDCRSTMLDAIYGPGKPRPRPWDPAEFTALSNLLTS